MKTQVFLKWLSLSQELKKVKAEEAELRRELCAELFDNQVGEFKEVRENSKILVTATSKVTRALDKDVLAEIEDSFTAEDRGAIVYKPSLDTRAYRKLPEDSIVHEAITEKPAMPALTVEIKA